MSHCLGLTMQRLSCKTTATKKVMLRAVKLFLLGLLLQGLLLSWFLRASLPLAYDNFKLDMVISLCAFSLHLVEYSLSCLK